MLILGYIFLDEELSFDYIIGTTIIILGIILTVSGEILVKPRPGGLPHLQP